MHPGDRPSRATTILLCVAVAIASMVVFLPSAGGTWILDDLPLIANNPTNQSFSHVGRWFTTGMWDMDIEASVRWLHHGFYRPLVLASYAFDWTVWQGNPLGFHLTNLALHGIVSVLAFFTLWRWSGYVRLAALAALLFAVHPAKAENVAWISGRTDVLCMIGVLLAAWGIALRARGRRSGIFAEIVGALLAYLSKEMAIVIPLLALVEIWLSRGRPALTFGEIRASLSRLSLWVPQALLVAVYLAVRQVALPFRTPISGLTPIDHVRYFLETAGRAVSLALYPDDLSLSAAALRRTSEGLVHFVGYELLGAATIVVCVLAVVLFARRRPAIAVGVLALVGSYLPVSNLVFGGESALIAPRFLYIPSLLGAWLLAESLALLFEAGWSSVARAGVALAVVVACVFGFRSWTRAQNFLGPSEFWAYELSEHPDVPEVLRAVIRHDLGEGESRLALQRAACGHRLAHERFNHRGDKGAFILFALKASGQLADDMPHERLEGMARFLEDVAAGRDATLDDPVNLSVPSKGLSAESLRRSSGTTLLMAARFWARAGRVDRARDAVRRALASCPQCRDLREKAELVRPLLIEFPPPSSLDEARGQAARLAQLGLWGRALRRLGPYLNDIVDEGPEAIEVTAGIALRAGDRTLAEELLSRLPEEAAARVRRENEKPPQRYHPRDMGTFVSGGCALPIEM